MKYAALILSLALSGCVQTRTLNLESESLRTDINERAALETTLVTLAWGETVQARLFNLGPDVATWLDPETQRFRSVLVSDVARVRFVRRGRGALEGAGVGLATAGGLAAAAAVASRDDYVGPGFAAAVVGVLAGPPLTLLGAIIGGVSGSKVAYESPVRIAPRPYIPTISPPSSPSIQTDAPEYVAQPTSSIEPRRGQRFPDRYAFTVVARYTNATPDTVYLTPTAFTSEPAYQVRAVQSDPAARAGSAYHSSAQSVEYDRFLPVGPGETRTDTLRLEGPQRDWRMNASLGLMQGRMVLVYPASRCRSRDRSCGLPDSAVVSNTFEVRLE